MTPAPSPAPIRIANCSGFYGDRRSAAREMVEGGPIDVLTGDWLAELTMLILAKDKLRNPDGGYAKTFVAQMGEVLATCLERGIKVVSNAGGLNPASCAAAVGALAAEAGLSPTIAHVSGDDLVGQLGALRAAGHDLANLDTGEGLADVGAEPITANAYLGGWGIATALEAGADVVITGRVTDAAVVVGPAAWHHGWRRTDWDALAGAVVAGHVIECGTQCTGGNYAFFQEVPGIERCGFPIAEVHADGSSVITKHPDTGGLVSVGTVTAQLLYEIQGLEYANPDAVVRFDTIHVDEDGPDRVRLSGIRGLPGPDEVKVAINYLGGWRNSMTFVLTGLDVEAKADVAVRTLWSLLPGGREAFDAVDVRLRRTDRPDPATNDDALAELRVTVMDRDKAKVGRPFSNTVIEMALASYPGLFTTSPPTDATSFGVYWPTLVPAEVPEHLVTVTGPDGTRTLPIEALSPDERAAPASVDDAPITAEHEAILAMSETNTQFAAAGWDTATLRQVPLGHLAGARSGDKGGNANIGVWARTDGLYRWLHTYLTADRLRELLPETAELAVHRYDLPALRAMNFVVVGLLGRGVAASTRSDPQAKGLGEYLRAKLVEVPEALLADLPDRNATGA
jgi:hypothetical protein